MHFLNVDCRKPDKEIEEDELDEELASEKLDEVDEVNEN